MAQRSTEAGAHLPAEIPHLELHIVVGDLLYVAAPDQTPSGCGAAGASSGVSRAGSPPNRGLCHDNLSKMQVVEDRGLARVAEADDDDLAAASRHRQELRVMTQDVKFSKAVTRKVITNFQFWSIAVDHFSLLMIDMRLT